MEAAAWRTRDDTSECCVIDVVRLGSPGLFSGSLSGTSVALKLMCWSNTRRSLGRAPDPALLRERGTLEMALTLAAAAHGALPVVATLEAQDAIACAMPFVPVTLRHLTATASLEPHPGASRAIAAVVLHDVCATLEALHSGACTRDAAECAHCDVSPDNVLVSADGTAHLCDFGSVRLVRGSALERPAACDAFRACAGGYNPAYCDPRLNAACELPEVCSTDDMCRSCAAVFLTRMPVAPDTAVDVYSLGASLLETVGTGTSPWHALLESMMGLPQDRPSAGSLRAAAADLAEDMPGCRALVGRLAAAIGREEAG